MIRLEARGRFSQTISFDIIPYCDSHLDGVKMFPLLSVRSDEKQRRLSLMGGWSSETVIILTFRSRLIKKLNMFQSYG